MNQRPVQSDIPPALALVVLLVVCGGLLFFANPELGAILQTSLDVVSTKSADLVGTSIMILIINVFTIAIFGQHLFGQHRQGSRLNALLGNQGRNVGPKLICAGLSAIVGFAIFLVLNEFYRWDLDYLLNWFSSNQVDWIVIGVNANLALGCAVAFYNLRHAVTLFRKVKNPNRKLPRFPEIKNSLVIGASGEDTGEDCWEVLNKRGLCGNILVSGSIGAGKSQGTILNYIEQALKNFDPAPAILAIDPKRTFVKETKEIASACGQADQIYHVTLGGDITFNPIYFENVLKDGKFLEAAHMIRSAAVNCMGSSPNSAIWDALAFNLVKNSIVFLGATKTYYTLNDLYSTIVRAGKTISDENGILILLQNALNSDRFQDEEERVNIQKAIEYFEYEFSDLDPKIHNSIVVTATSFLNQFQEYQAGQTFCPDAEDLVLKSMDDVVDNGGILLLDIRNEALAKAMGTFFKLHYQKSVLGRTMGNRSKRNLALLMIDEYQDVVTVGDEAISGDEGFLAKARESNAVTIAATQSISSLINRARRENAAKELIQNFRTRIALHSSDLATCRLFQELYGREEQERKSHSVSELSQKATKNYFEGGLKHKSANVTETVGSSEVKDYVITPRELARLTTFEAYAQVYDGVCTNFKKLFLKPYFLKRKDRNLSHRKILKHLATASMAVFVFLPGLAKALPSVCSVVKAPEFSSCQEFNVGMCMCGFPPRPCARFSYYVPQTFIEVMPDKKSTFFGVLPGAAAQLAVTSKGAPFGAEADHDTQSFQSHTVAVPLASIPYQMLPCGGTRTETSCFDAMSEHVDWHWRTGAADSMQPKFLAWGLSPKACLIKGAIDGAIGGGGVSGGGGGGCSYPIPWLPHFPPSSREACNGWGVFYPRYGSYNGPSQTIGALMIASRLRNLGTEVFSSVPTDPDEKFQMIYPQSSSCFREGQNIGWLEGPMNVRETQRLTNGKLKGHLFTVWKKVSCCRDLAEVPVAIAGIAAMSAVCKTLGAL